MLSRTLTLYKDSFSGLSRDIWLLAFVTLINRSGAMVVPFLTIYFTSQLGFSLAQSGILMALFGVGGVAAMWLGGWLTDKYGYYPVAFWSLLASGFCLWGLQYLSDFQDWCWAMPLAGLAADCFRPANMAAIGAYSRPENRTRSLTLIRLAINLGFAVGPGVAGLLSATVGFQWLFMIDGVTCIIGALLFVNLLENRPVHEEKADAAASIEKEKLPFDQADSPWQDRIFTLFNIINFLIAFSFLQFLYTLPVYFEQELGLAKTTIGLLLGFNGAVIFFTEMQVIYILEEKARPLRLLSLGSILFFISFFSLTFISWAWVGLFAMLLLTVGEIISFPFAASFALSRAKPENRGAFMGAYGLPWSMAAVLSPIVGMWIAQAYGFTALWLLMSIFCLIAALGMEWLNRKI